MAKSACVAYLLWLFGGIFGLHHFYLGRDRHAFAWFATLGGVFGLGWLREITRIPDYVREANHDPEYIEKRVVQMRQRKRPPYSSTRVAGELIVGTLFGYVLSLAIPSEEEYGVTHRWGQLLVPFAVATGVHLVGNIGMERGGLKWPVVGSYVASLIFLFNPNAIAWTAVVATFLFNWKSRDWVRQPAEKKRNFLVRVAVLMLFGALYISLWGSFLYFNAKYTSPEGDVTTFREGVDNFLHSKAWLQVRATWEQLMQYGEHHGWQHVFEELIASIDPFGESRAYQILELPSTATQKEVASKFRKLSREYHPDKNRDPAKKATAEKRFIEITQAYEKISKINANRNQHRTQSTEL